MDLIYPPVLDIQLPGGSVTSLPISEPRIGNFLDTNDLSDSAPSSSGPEPKLAFSSGNYQLLAYLESLNRLLTNLDGVESFGDRNVREARREVVREVEREASRVEKWWKSAWRAHVEGRRPQDSGVELPGRWVDTLTNGVGGMLGFGAGKEEDTQMRRQRRPSIY
ncbi:hypothetical protein BDN72DRAFT_850784 [Pluteus cervinus]|uniref:Uncharacterized protein n=1 Tax=Pluteus cervinus TaxID=181527 RepID=A0ACD3A4J0_9AGAR|nr:hypothetical protein BDN72DRAFT_850784 [Pluteus cervinus]